MAWKKDLEKLKQALGAEDPTPPKPAPPPRPQAKPTGNRPIEEEDEMFLSAMGQRAQPRKAIAPEPVQAAPAPSPVAAPAPAPGAEFASAMGGLKGIVPIRTAPVTAPKPPPAPLPVAPPQVAAQPETPEPEPPPAPDVPVPSPAPAPPQAVQINLAAGMAIEVDGVLDLKGHGRTDAEERLKERIIDGRALGWRTLHVLLGPSEDLRQMLLEMLASPAAAGIARFAQAPIPMGGAQAWILYFRIAVPDGN